MTTQKQNIIVHGTIYRAHDDPDGTYDGTLWTEKDCLAIVDNFYKDIETTGKSYPVNFKHLKQQRDILGFIEDLYFFQPDKTLNAVFTIYTKQKHYDEVKNMLMNYKSVKDQLHKTDDEINMKDLVGLSIEGTLKYDGVDENGYVTDPTKLKVIKKDLNAISVVINPDHYADKTFVTSFTFEDEHDLVRQDPKLREYVSSETARPETKQKYFLDNTVSNNKTIDTQKPNNSNSINTNNINKEKGNFFCLFTFI